MKVIFTSETKEDFRKHNDYVRKQKKSDGHKYQSYELKGINKSFKKRRFVCSPFFVIKKMFFMFL